MKRVAILFRQSPFRSNRLQETIDIALAYAAFDQAVTLIFLEDAVLACCADTHPEAAGYADFLKQFAAFSLYDIEQTLVSTEALQLRGLSALPLRADVLALPAAEIAQRLGTFDLVISI